MLKALHITYRCHAQAAEVAVLVQAPTSLYQVLYLHTSRCHQQLARLTQAYLGLPYLIYLLT